MNDKKMVIESIIEKVKTMNAIDLMELVKAIEETFGVTAVAPVMGAVAADAGDAGAKKEEKTEFKVVIKDVGTNTVNVIKALRALLPGLGLKEAKDMATTEGAVVKEAASKDEADKMKKALTEAGATVDVS